jgi:hypothetical protein
VIFIVLPAFYVGTDQALYYSHSEDQREVLVETKSAVCASVLGHVITDVIPVNCKKKMQEKKPGRRTHDDRLTGGSRVISVPRGR